MSNHPTDSQPPADSHSDVPNLADTDDFWDLDDDTVKTPVKLEATQPEPADDEEFWDLDQADTTVEPTSEQDSEENKDFWDLNNQYSDADSEAPFAEIEDDVKELTAPIEAESKPNITSNTPEPSKADKVEKLTPHLKKKAIVTASTAALSPVKKPENTKEETVAEKTEIAGKTQPVSQEKSTEDKKSRRSPIELISSLICYLAIIALFTYLVKYVSQQHDFNTEPSYATNVPVSGEFASIASVETWWEKPAPNKAKYGVVLVPVAKITLGDDAKSGRIRSLFFNPANEHLNREAERKGDAITTEFSNGKFLETGTNEITIYATDGYEELAHFNFYRGQTENRWTIEIRETGEDQTSTEFKYLAKAPIEPTSK